MRFLPPGPQEASSAVGDREVNDYGVKNATTGKPRGYRSTDRASSQPRGGSGANRGGRGGSTRCEGLRQGWENGQRERPLIREGCRGLFLTPLDLSKRVIPTSQESCENVSI